jgi:hypothetical protein
MDLTPNSVAALPKLARSYLRTICEYSARHTRPGEGEYALIFPNVTDQDAQLLAEHTILSLLRARGAINARVRRKHHLIYYPIAAMTWKTLQAGLRLARERLQKEVCFVEKTETLAIRLGWGVRTAQGFHWRHPDNRVLYLLQDLLADRLRGDEVTIHYPLWHHMSLETLLDLLQVGVKEKPHLFVIYPRYQRDLKSVHSNQQMEGTHDD